MLSEEFYTLGSISCSLRQPLCKSFTLDGSHPFYSFAGMLVRMVTFTPLELRKNEGTQCWSVQHLRSSDGYVWTDLSQRPCTVLVVGSRKSLADRGAVDSRPLYLLLQLLATNAAVQEVFYCILFLGVLTAFFFSRVSSSLTAGHLILCFLFAQWA